MVVGIEKPGVLPIPEPDLTPAEMLARAVALRPQLYADQEGADQRGYYSEDLHRAFTDAGFYRILQPRMFGGYAFDMTTYYRLLVEIARGGSAGISWCLALGTHHSLILAAFWPEQAQRDIFGEHNGHFVCPARAGAGGTARKVDGGYVINGRWRYSSGAPYATHHMAAVRITSDRSDGLPNESLAWACVPRDQFEIMWDWGGGNDLGLQASGSDTVEMHDAFVPDHYVVPDTWFGLDQSNGSYGTRLHDDPKYLGIIGSFFHGALVAPQIGAVRAALDEFEQILRTTKNRMGPPVLQMQDRGFQTSFGLALALVDSAEMILRQCGDQFTEYSERWARTGEPYAPEDDTRLHAALQQAGRLTWRAMEQIWTAAPVDAAKRNAHLARYYRDVSMYRLHLSSRPLTLAPRLAELHFGLTRETLPGGPG